MQAIAPEKIILFGSHATGRWVEDKYVSDGILYEYISDYDVLVIMKADEDRKDYEVQDIIENRCHYHTPVTVIVHDITFVNKMLSEGQYFFTDIEEEGILLYDTGDVPLATRKPLSPAEAKEIAQEYYDQLFESGQEFLKGAKFYASEKNLKIGVFMLHQAAERTYNAVMLVFTSYKPKTITWRSCNATPKTSHRHCTMYFPATIRKKPTCSTC